MYFGFDRDNGVIWRPEGEAEPAWSVMPSFAIRRKRRGPKARRDPAPRVDPALAFLKERESKLAQRVEDEQRRTGLERPHCMAVLELERVRDQLAAG
jgi:hypothetical protein